MVYLVISTHTQEIGYGLITKIFNETRQNYSASMYYKFKLQTLDSILNGQVDSVLLFLFTY